MQDYRFEKIQITLDGDKESHDKIRNQGGKPSFDKILQNSIALCNSCSDAVIKLRINYNTDNIQHDLVRYFVKYLKICDLAFLYNFKEYGKHIRMKVMMK